MGATTERWRWVDGYEGLYLVSNMGAVLGLPRCGKDARELKDAITPNGYHQVTLYDQSGTPTRFLVHRIVAKAFVGGYDVGLEVNHKNGNRSDNRAENLEWVTRSENELHKCRVLRTGHRKPSRRMFTDDQVRAIRNSTIGLRQLARMYGVSPNAIRQIRNRVSYQEVI